MRSHECGLVQRHSTTSPSMVRVSERLNAAPDWCAGARPAYALPRTRTAAASLEIMARVRAPPSVDCRSLPFRPSAPVSTRRMPYPPRISSLCLTGARTPRAADQAEVNRFHELRRRPQPVVRAVATVVIACRLRRAHLFERHSFVDHALNAVANDCQHVAVLDDVRLVREPAMAGDHHRTAFLFLLRNRQRNDVVQ